MKEVLLFLMIIALSFMSVPPIIANVEYEGVFRSFVRICSVFSFAFIVIVGSIVLAFWYQDYTYKGGQIDALEGVQKYEKVYTYRSDDSIPIDSAYVYKFK